AAGDLGFPDDVLRRAPAGRRERPLGRAAVAAGSAPPGPVVLTDGDGVVGLRCRPEEQDEDRKPGVVHPASIAGAGSPISSSVDTFPPPDATKERGDFD